MLDADTLKPIADEVSAKRSNADRLRGGGTRNIFANKPVRNMADMKGLKVRAGRADLSKTFAAAGMSPTVIAYDEIYNAIQNGVISAGENEAAGVETMKFYEVGPNLNMTQHAITIGRSASRARRSRAAARPAGRDPEGRQGGRHLRPAIESSEDSAKLDAMERPAS